MQCDHPRIKSVDCVLFCCDCGAILPPEWNRPSTNPPPKENPQEATQKPAKRKPKADQ